MSANVSATNESSTSSLSVEQRRSREKRHWWISTALVPILFLGLSIGIVGIALFLHEWRPIPPDPDPNQLPPDETKLIGGGVNANVSGIRFQLQRATFDVSYAQAKQSLLHLKSAEQEWSTLLDATLHDAAGNQIAASDELLLSFVALRQLPVPVEPNMTAAELKREVDELAKNVSEENENSLRSNTEIIESVSQHALVLYAFHQARSDQLRILRNSAQSIVPSPYKLSVAVSKRPTTINSKLEATAEKRKLETEAILSEEIQRLKTRQADAVAVVEQLTARLKSVQNGEVVDAADSDEAAIPLATRQEYRGDYERIRVVLTAFTTPGYVQPETAYKLVFHDTKQPVSYSALKRVGALEDSDKGLAILFRVGGSKSATQQNDRPLGAFPRMNSISELQKPNTVARVKEAQQLLRKYGVFLIEDGLLTP